MKYLLLTAILLAPPAQAWPRAGGGGGGGGCFAAGTIVATTAGGTPIEKLRPGDMVLAYFDGRIMQVAVESFFKKKARLLTVITAKHRLVTTGEHPLLTRSGFVEAGSLGPGEEIAMLREGRRVWVKIKAIRHGTETSVYNLEVAPPHTFIADGFVVHNKGGGGYYRRNGRRPGIDGGTTDITTFLTLAMAALVLLVKAKERFFESPAQRRLLSREEVSARASQTRAIMTGLASADNSLRPEDLEAVVRSIFLDMQTAWQARDYSALPGRIAPELCAGHSAKVAAMRARGEVNMMEDVSIDAVDFVHVRYPSEREGRSFTALITASARDYTVDETSGTLLSGSRARNTFQEFWSFRLLDGLWVPARIDQTTEDYILTAPNLPSEPDASASGILAAHRAPAEAPARPASPGIPRGAPPSGDWDRQKMEITAATTFLNVYGAWESGGAGELRMENILPATAARIKKIMATAAAEGLRFEFRDLYARKAEIVMTAQARSTVSGLDEFTARINASAVRTLGRAGKPLHRDAAAAPFTEYWVFARAEGKWKFSEILPRIKQEDGDACQADIAPTPAQLEWYWETGQRAPSPGV